VAVSTFLLPLLVVASLLAVLAGLAQRRDPALHARARAAARQQLLMLAPRLPFALLAAELIGRQLPRDQVLAWLGEGAGMLGVAIASLLGIVLPGGPMVAFPLAIALARAGAAQPVLVALITAWALMAVNRTLLFEVPLMGTRFTLKRILASVLLAPMAGVMAMLFA
jgi:uncharacterized membrane protein YraQ (UPF0718 family)